MENCENTEQDQVMLDHSYGSRDGQNHGVSKKRKIEEVDGLSSEKELIAEWIRDAGSVRDLESGVCPVCNKYLQSAIKKHFYVCHRVLLFECDQCEQVNTLCTRNHSNLLFYHIPLLFFLQTFLTQSEYQSHMDIHEKEKPFGCHMCSAVR